MLFLKRWTDLMIDEKDDAEPNEDVWHATEEQRAKRFKDSPFE